MKNGILVLGGSVEEHTGASSSHSMINNQIILHKNIRYSSHYLFKMYLFINVCQLFVEFLILFIRNKKNSIFTLSQLMHLTRGRTNFGFEIPHLILSLKNIMYTTWLTHVVYHNIPCQIVNTEGCSAAEYKWIICKWGGEALIYSPSLCWLLQLIILEIIFTSDNRK